ncbi:TetR family transcriptional regulator C-terminal domain-containing protein [Curtobacterium sp. RRHDQ10]|uniref:LmrA/YxaF family transcription factor n=1 Tax=Curtobacterium phyllosphaerae TaxID=3413379 RepID=UPI003BF1A036
MAQQSAPSDETLAASMREGVAAWASLLAQRVERMQAAGAIDRTVDAARVGTGIVAAIMGGLALSQPERDGAPLAAALDLAFRGLRSLGA